MKLDYQRMNLEQLHQEYACLMEAKMALMKQQEQRKQQFNQQCIEIELLKSMADGLLEIILLNQKIQTVRDLIQRN